MNSSSDSVGRLPIELVFAGRHVIEDVGAQVLDAVVAEAEAAGGEGRVAAAIFLGGLFQHQHLGALLGGGQRGAQGGVAGADDDHVPLGINGHSLAPNPERRDLRRAQSTFPSNSLRAVR